MVNLAMQDTLRLTENSSFAKILADKFSDLNLCIFVNARLRKTWRIEKRMSGYTLIIPSIFLDADDEIKTALLQWVKILIYNKFSRKKTGIAVKRQIKDLEKLIYGFLTEEVGLNSRRSFFYPGEKFKYTQGVKFDLQEVFQKINRDFFNGELDCFLRWGRGKSRTSYHAVCSDENGKPFHLITIAGFYNQKNIPDFALESVMYHEMLHIAIPPITIDVKRSVHHRQFREMERQFPYYKKWKEWQKKTLIRRIFI